MTISRLPLCIAFQSPYHAEKILLKDKYKDMDLQSIITLLWGRFKELSTKDEKEEKALNANENLGYRIIC